MNQVQQKRIPKRCVSISFEKFLPQASSPSKNISFSELPKFWIFYASFKNRHLNYLEFVWKTWNFNLVRFMNLQRLAKLSIYGCFAILYFATNIPVAFNKKKIFSQKFRLSLTKRLESFYLWHYYTTVLMIISISGSSFVKDFFAKKQEKITTAYISANPQNAGFNAEIGKIEISVILKTICNTSFYICSYWLESQRSSIRWFGIQCL